MVEGLKNTLSRCIGVLVAAWQEFFLWWIRCFRGSQEFYGYQSSPVILKRYTYTGENNDIIGIDSCSEPPLSVFAVAIANDTKLHHTLYSFSL